MTEEAVKILCVDDEPNVLRALNRLFLDDDYEILTAESGQEGLAVLEAEYPVQVVVSDYRMPEMNGVDFLKRVCARWPDTVRIVLSGYADAASVVGAINEGQIYRFIPKPWNDDELKVTIAKAAELFFLRRHNQELAERLRESNEELKQLNENLEHLVEERTNELRFQNAALRHAQFILDTLPVGVLGVDPAGLLVQCNQRARELLGGPIEVGAMAREALPPQFGPVLEEIGQGRAVDTRITVDRKRFRVKGALMAGSDDQQGMVLVLGCEAENG